MLSRRSILQTIAAAGSVQWSGNVLPQVRTSVPLVLMDGADPALMKPLMQMIADAAGLEWQVQSVPFARMKLMAARGQALAFGIAKTAEREQQYLFSNAVLNGYVWLIVRQEHPFAFNQIEDLRGRHVCVPNGVSLGTNFDAAKGQVFTAENIGGPFANGFAMLKAGRCDALLFSSHIGPDHLVVQDVLRKGIGARSDIAVLPKPLTVSEAGFSVGRDQPLASFMSRINAAISQTKPQIAALLKGKV